jgi:Leucine-rich repeat (LRR) protein
MNRISDISSLSNLGKLKRLTLDQNQIADISALSNLTDLRVIWLDNNNITDISPLSGLIRIGEVEQDWWLDQREGIAICLGLGDNQIADIEALVGNEGLSEGDGVDLRGNPLGRDALNTYLPQLEERGVNVLYDV